MAVDFALYALSRRAIRTIPMTCFALGSMLVVSLGRRRTFGARVGAGLTLFAVSVLTKLSIIAALPVFICLVFLSGVTAKQRRLACGYAVLFVVGGVKAMHGSILHLPTVLHQPCL